MNRTKPETHQACRSLLQKAVRRGNRSLTSTIVHHLRAIGDTNWLKTRTFVITFEECWPLGAYPCTTVNFDSLLTLLLNVTEAVKMKDAAGLGSLAYEHSQGDCSVLSGVPEDKHVLFLSHAIKNADQFWQQTIQESKSDNQLMLIEAAHKAYRRGGWPWDRAFMQAAAYLALQTDDFTVPISNRIQHEEFPYWIALDKHTSQGKSALREAAKVTGIATHQLSWISFYLESAHLNDATPSYWWSREIQWRLQHIGLSYNQAQLIWNKARPVLRTILQKETEWLQQHLNEQTMYQHSHQEVEQERLWIDNVAVPQTYNHIITLSPPTNLPVQYTLPGF